MRKENSMARVIALLYGLIAYVAFAATIIYSIGFVTGLVVPKTIDSGPAGPPMQAIVINLLLMSLFAIQHSVMARPQFKKWWTRIVPAAVERSTFVLFSSLTLAFLFWQWQPIPAVVWQVTNPQVAALLLGLSLFGWVFVFVRQAYAGSALQNPASLQSGAPPDLSWFSHLLLGDPGHDRRPSPVRHGYDGLHLRRDRP
jgi:protein-S-isoprenylcysteine O-methyltransferase Ste14